MSGKFVVIILCFLRIVLCDQQAQEQQQTDSYLSALHESHATGAASNYHESDQYQQQPMHQQKNQYYNQQHQQQNQYYNQQNQHQQQNQYNQQHSQQENNKDTYYPSSYAHQQPHPPDHTEGTEMNFGNYEYKDFEYPHHEEPPKHLSPPPDPPTDYSWLLKLAALAVGKFLLKVIIIKKIVKFFSVIVFLFVLPAFFATIAKHVTLHGFGRKINNEELNNRSVENLAKFVITSIQGFKNAPNCSKNKEEWSCRLNGMFNIVDSKYPVKGLLKNLRKDFGFDVTKVTVLKPTKVEYS
uniref:Uncharacterized protein n=1 Tax=Lutzomyia longipalpis TaxID=7200 RepID=A0A1B0CS32_LUTLO